MNLAGSLIKIKTINIGEKNTIQNIDVLHFSDMLFSINILSLREFELNIHLQ